MIPKPSEAEFQEFYSPEIIHRKLSENKRIEPPLDYPSDVRSTVSDFRIDFMYITYFNIILSLHSIMHVWLPNKFWKQNEDNKIEKGIIWCSNKNVENVEKIDRNLICNPMEIELSSELFFFNVVIVLYAFTLLAVPFWYINSI